MSRPRTPLAKAMATGQVASHPERYAGRSQPKVPALGEPSEWMTENQRRAWEDFKREIFWLRESDRTLVEIASCLRAQMMAGTDTTASALGQLRQCISAMGGTPADLSKVNVPYGQSEDPAEAYFDS